MKNLLENISEKNVTTFHCVLLSEKKNKNTLNSPVLFHNWKKLKERIMYTGFTKKVPISALKRLSSRNHSNFLFDDHDKRDRYILYFISSKVI